MSKALFAAALIVLVVVVQVRAIGYAALNDTLPIYERITEDSAVDYIITANDTFVEPPLRPTIDDVLAESAIDYVASAGYETTIVEESEVYRPEIVGYGRQSPVRLYSSRRYVTPTEHAPHSERYRSQYTLPLRNGAEAAFRRRRRRQERPPYSHIGAVVDRYDGPLNRSVTIDRLVENSGRIIVRRKYSL